MRPARFETFVVQQLASHHLVARAAALRDIGDTGHPYGVAVQLAEGGEWRWQITAQSAPGEVYGRPEVPTEGAPAPGAADPETAAPWGPDDAEALLAAAIAAAGNPEVASVCQWSVRGPGAGTYGVTVRCHNGALLFLRALAPGRP